MLRREFQIEDLDARQVHAIDRAVEEQQRMDRWFAVAAEGSKSDEAKWLCLAVRARSEISVKEALVGHGIVAMVPTTTIVVRDRRHGGSRTIRAAMIGGYVFCKLRIDPASIVVPMSLPSVIGILGGPERPHVVPDLDISMLEQQASAWQPSPIREEKRARVGDRVRLDSGPFRGLEGRVEAARRSVVFIRLFDFENSPPIQVNLTHLRNWTNLSHG